MAANTASSLKSLNLVAENVLVLVLMVVLIVVDRGQQRENVMLAMTDRLVHSYKLINITRRFCAFLLY